MTPLCRDWCTVTGLCCPFTPTFTKGALSTGFGIQKLRDEVLYSRLTATQAGDDATTKPSWRQGRAEVGGYG